MRTGKAPVVDGSCRSPVVFFFFFFFSGFRVSGLRGFGVLGFGFSGFRVSGFRVLAWGLRTGPGLGFWISVPQLL